MTYRLFIYFMLLGAHLSAQDILTRDEALSLALQHNYSIQVAQKSVEAAKSNASFLNSGFLPHANISAGGNVNYSAGENETFQGTQSYDATAAYSYNASIGITHTIFNGFGRWYGFKQLMETHNLSKLQAQQIVENTAIQLSSAYFQIAQLSETVGILEQSLAISKERKLRAEYRKEYGQSTQLDVLNAKVDVNNDSINLINTLQQLENAKRNLNLIMGRALDVDFGIDTTITFSLGASKEDFLNKALERNILIQQTSSSLKNSEYAIKAARAGWFPALTANAGYGYQGSDNPNGAFLTGSQSYGPQAGLSLSWNIFDGGTTRTRQRAAKIAMETQKIQQEQTELTVQRDVLNAYSSYQNTLFVLNAQSDNLATAQRNFERSDEMYKQGQITSLEFRAAQLNMLSTQSSYSQAKYNAKNAELELMRLTGVLIND